jgi:hypothetical protein
MEVLLYLANTIDRFRLNRDLHTGCPKSPPKKLIQISLTQLKQFNCFFYNVLVCSLKFYFT